MYLSPMLGAWLADAKWGKYLVIVVFSLVYFLGMAGISLVNLVPSIRPVGGAPPPGAPTLAIFWLAMALMGFGSGGIKPCVSAFGADQFDEKVARERSWRASFFNWFYLSVNVGSLIATSEFGRRELGGHIFGFFWGGGAFFVFFFFSRARAAARLTRSPAFFFSPAAPKTPPKTTTVVLVPVQETKGYGIGYSVPAACFAVAILAYVAGTPIYTRLPPQGSPFTRLYGVLRGAWRNRALPLPADPSELHEEDAGARERREAEAKEAAAAAAAEDDGGDCNDTNSFVERLPLAQVGSGSFSKWRRGGLGFGGRLTGNRRRQKPRAKAAAAAPAVAPIDRIPHTEGMSFLDKAAIKRSAADDAAAAVGGGDGDEGGLPVVAAAKPTGCCGGGGGASAKPPAPPITVSMVEESKAFYRLMPIFGLVAIWQMTYDPIFSLFPFPGDMMERRLGAFKIPASSISFANTFGVILTIPFYDMVLVPLFKRLGRPITVTQRIGAGFVLQLVALLMAGATETMRYRVAAPVRARYERDGGGVLTRAPDPSAEAYVQPMSIWVQFAPYYILGAAEVFTNVGVMELMYIGVSSGMRSIGAAVYLLSVALGTILATSLNLVVGAASHSDPWINDNPLYGHYDYYFYLNAAILLAAFLVYVPVSRAYVERPVAGGEHGGGDGGGEEDAAEARAAARRRFEDKAGAHLDPEDNAVIALDKK